MSELITHDKNSICVETVAPLPIDDEPQIPSN